MKLHVQREHGALKRGDVVRWCSKIQSVKNLIDAGILGVKPPVETQAKKKES